MWSVYAIKKTLLKKHETASNHLKSQKSMVDLSFKKFFWSNLFLHLLTRMGIGNRLMFRFFSWQILHFWRNQVVYLFVFERVNCQKGPLSEVFDKFLFTFAFWKVPIFWTLIWKMSNSVLNGIVVNNNALNMRQCRHYIRYLPQKRLGLKFRALSSQDG